MERPRGSSKQNITDLLDSIKLKCALLTEGVNVDSSVLSLSSRYKPRIESIYGHHRNQKSEFRIPQEIVLHKPDNVHDNEAIVAQLRYNPLSDLSLRVEGEKPILSLIDREVEIDFIPTPGFYNVNIAPNKPLWSIAQLLGTDVIGIVPSNSCAYFATQEECRFCELLPTYLEEKEYAKSVKSLTDQQQALRVALSAGEGKYVVLTSGNYDLENLQTVQSFVDVLSSVTKKDGIMSCAFLTPPRDLSQIDILKKAGLDAIGFNMEVWREDLFNVMVPGKSRYLGKDKLLDALRYAVDTFGSGNVYTNFVYGIQSLDTTLLGGTYNHQKEKEICLEATDSLLEDQIIPLFTVYHSTGKNRIGHISIFEENIFDFSLDHGQAVYKSGLISPEKNAMLFGLGSIANHLYNDFYFLAKSRANQ